MPVLSATDVAVNLQGQCLLQNVSLQVSSGQLLAIIGPNGAGKTTLMRALTGDIPVAGNQILFDGQPLDQIPHRQRARQLAFLPQHSQLDFPFTVTDVVAMGRIPHETGRQIDRAIVDAALAEMDVQHLAGRLYTRLSGGEKQRVQLARVLAQVWRQEDAAKRLLVLDEPTSSLDVAHAQQLMQALTRFANRGVAVVFIVHDFNLASRYAHWIIALAGGQISAQGKPETVMTPQNLRRIFSIETTVIPHPQSGRPVVIPNETTEISETCE